MRARPVVLAACAALSASLFPVVAGAPLAAADERGAVAVERSRAAVGDARDRLAQAQAALPRAQAELERATRALRGAQARERAVAAELVRAQRAERAATAQVARTRAALAEAERTAAALAHEVYVQGLDGPARQLSVALGARDAQELAAAVALTSEVSQRQSDQIAHLDAQRARLAEHEAALSAARSEVQRREAAAEAVVERERSLVTRASRSRDRVTALVAVRAEAVARAEATKRLDEAQYRAMQDEAAALKERLATMAATGVPPVSGSGLVVPAEGSFTSPYGMRTHPITGVHKLHTGMDIANSCGTPILAAQAGRVVEAEYASGYGYRTVIDHGVVGGRRLATAYSHQQGLQTATGQSVAQGQVIGEIGTTGYSTGCHLHFEVLVDGEYVDPEPYLR
ncbi:peptidoglycan DD-metalloendopeptidase family protein [Vallicoccus soli]|uniref:peptidoglycan DD-metalloendopeptidase family protein n=1 Tax=Vallicoccus soli TaxID=2339232 RepID=UPI00105A3273|nr:M23 family metallopeptidase [Vallicoccus soli]